MRKIVERDPPARDPDYLERVRKLPCVSCGYPPPSVAHHVSGMARGVGQKISDYDTIPLCQNPCHITSHSSTPAGSAMRDEQPQWLEETKGKLA